MRFRSALILFLPLALIGCGGAKIPSVSTTPQPPVANAGGPYKALTGAAINFDGSHSSDPQAEALTYSWNFGDRSTGTGPSPTHSYSSPGSYNVSLTVTDTSNLTATGTSTATISAPPPPAANAGGPYSGQTGAAINFSGIASSDPLGETLTYSWDFGDGITGTGPSLTHTYSKPGSYTVSLTVTDTSMLSNTARAMASITLGPAASISGVVSTGQKPIADARVYLLAANSTGYGAPSLSVLTAADTGSSDSVGAYTTTNSAGAFTFPSSYTCNIGTQLYLYATGGDSGSGENPSSGLLAAIGYCPSSPLSATVNEVSTIATAYSIAGFATDATHVSSSNTSIATTGVANAFATPANLETLSTGSTLATISIGNGTAPQTKLNTLANLLEACVNAGSSCTSLFSLTTSDGTASGTRPADTATAAINIAHNPAANVAALYALAASSSTYAPALTAQPNDLLLGIRFQPPTVEDPIGIAIDSAGSVWYVDMGGQSPIPDGNVVELSNAGAPLSGANGFTGGGIFYPFGIAIDLSGNAWVTNDQTSNVQVNSGSIVEISTSQSTISNYGAANAVEPLGIAIDPSGNAWIGGYLGTDLLELSSSGSLLFNQDTGNLPGPEAIAVDPTGNVWAATATKILEYSSSGSLLSGSGYPGGGFGIAIDHQGNVWASATGSNSSQGIVKLSSSGVTLSPSGGFTGGGLYEPYAFAIDGDGNIWVANPLGGCVSEFANSGTPISPSTGFILEDSRRASSPYGIAIDQSGNVWLSRNGNPSTIYEIVGAATPVVVPLVQAVKTNTLGARP